MSLSGLANWALSGGASGGNDDNNDDNNNSNDNSSQQPEAALTEEEIRARRMARIEAMQKRQEEAAAAAASKSEDEPQPMDVDDDGGAASASATSPKPSPTKGSAPMDTDMNSPSQSSAKTTSPSPQPASKKAKQSADPTSKIQRKKELLIKKTMMIAVGKNQNDSTCVPIQIDDPTTIGTSTIAELFANRLALPANARELTSTVPAQKPLIPYLATCYRKAADEAKSVRQTAQKKKQQQQDSADKTSSELESMLEEIQNQAVNYAGSALLVPELFEQSAGSADQLHNAALQSSSGTAGDGNLFFAVAGKDSSFYHMVCAELQSQDNDSFVKIVLGLVARIAKDLKACETVNDGVGPTSALGLVTALTSVCSAKAVSVAVTTKLDLYNAANKGDGCRFLPPPEGTPAASEKVPAPPLPPGPPGEDPMSRIMRMQQHQRTKKPYKKRSGVFVERDTLLGLVLRVSTPREDMTGPFKPSSVFRMSPSAAEGHANQQRNQLKVYQNACQQLVTNLLKGGPVAREPIMKWFADFLILNEGATAFRPNAAKVASESLLLNASNVLMKLCNPFVSDESKHGLINLGFVSDAAANRGVFPTQGDDALRRLGGNEEGDVEMSSKPYEPTNTFIPQCFFYCARSLALGIVPGLSKHESLERQIAHTYWDLRNRNEDPQNSRNLGFLIMMKNCTEVTLFQEDMVVDSLRFCNLMAEVLVKASDEELRQMPEFLVDTVCDIVTGIAGERQKMLAGLNFGNVFQMVVKLLSPAYATIVTNYNLRAKLGDVLYELYLPDDSTDRRRRRDVPASVTCDPMRGGQTYLLSDPNAQATLAPSLLLLYGEVEHTGFYEKNSHRSKICKLIKYLWNSQEHRSAFQGITANPDTFIVFANGIMNETNHLMGDVMQKLPEIRATQLRMENTAEWGRLSEEEQTRVSEALEENERMVKSSLPLVNQTLAMFGYLNTDEKIRKLFLLPDLLPRLVGMLNHTSSRLVGRQGLELKVKDPEQYEFKPKEMLRDLSAIFALFASNHDFQLECARRVNPPDLLTKAVATCSRLNLLMGESLKQFQSLPDLVDAARLELASGDEALKEDAPDEFKDELMSEYMDDPVILPSGHRVDRSTIKQHLLNDKMDPFNRAPMTIDDVRPDVELKERMDKWLAEKRAARDSA
mmetsp:Transcript_14536/g.35287  ORF Transcript_14536/g.35287 Transcript_14536/m.35287 type:complete len:1159 (+) Transcript_14536:100-3576(+)